MHFEKKFKKNGEVKYRFRYRKDGKLKVYSVALAPKVKTDDEAQTFCNNFNMREGSARDRQAKRLAFQKKYSNVDDLVPLYEKEMKKRAPNSYKNNVHNFKHYVLPFFLGVKADSNFKNWPSYYYEYRQWLDEQDLISSNEGKKISTGTKNHAIKALNTFIDFLFLRGMLDYKAKCPNFSAKFQNQRTEEDLISETELDDLVTYLRSTKDSIDNNIADFIYMLYWTGLRLSEARGIHLMAINPSVSEFPNYDTKYGIDVFGHIYLDSQLAEDDQDDERKPLKHRHQNSGSDGVRLIPIIKKDLWNILARKVIAKKSLVKKSGDIVLLFNLSKNIISSRLRTACSCCKIKYRSPHCFRHTFSTWLVGQTDGNYLVAQKILGHRNMKETERYVHLHGQSVKKSQATNALATNFAGINVIP